jgi:hypothetical protein
MDNVFYLLSASSSCIEGICLSKKNNTVFITKDSVGFSALNESDSAEERGTDSEQWIKRIGQFLDSQQWRDHSITFLLPAEDVTFRKITFPFQERKKVEQALPFELEEELMGELADSAYSVQVHLMSEQNSEALVLLMERQRLEQLQQLCLERDLLIRNIDCAAYALFRSKINDNSGLPEAQDLFQIYLGGDETFVNTIRDGRLDEIKIFPNSIPEILRKHCSAVETTLPNFLQTFAKTTDTPNNAESKNAEAEAFLQLKEELRWLCAQLTLHLRIKNYSSESQIQVHGIFGPLIKWDGVVFRIRSFPLPEAQAFAERSGDVINFSASSDVELKEEKTAAPKLEAKAPDTLEELMVEAKQREESDEQTQNDSVETDHKPAADKTDEQQNEQEKQSAELDAVNQQESLLSLTERKHWGMLGELRKKAEIFLEPHKLSLYHESTPWRRFIRRNRGAVAVAASLMIIISVSFVWQTNTKLNLLQQDIARSERLVKAELRRVLPQTSASGVNTMLMELQEKIKKRKDYIENSIRFEKRDYFNLKFLNNISTLLDVDAPFQVDSLEYAPERFSLSGTIDSYDRLQLLKNNLQEFEEFKGRNIIESNRKSPEGIVYRITIELK